MDDVRWLKFYDQMRSGERRVMETTQGHMVTTLQNATKSAQGPESINHQDKKEDCPKQTLQVRKEGT